MKKSEHEENTMEPMFPRLHVNDTDKGPRAPPRNKMALYEQLSIPSQHFSPRVSPLTANRNNNLLPTATSSQGTGYDQISVNLSSSTHTDLAKNLHGHRYGVRLNSSLLQPKQGKKLEEDDDSGPVLGEPRTGQYKMQIGKKTISPRLKVFEPTGKLNESDEGAQTTHFTNLRPDLRSRNEQESDEAHQSKVQFAKPATKVSGKLSNGQVHIQKSSTGRSQSDYRECVNGVPESPRDAKEHTSLWHRSGSSGNNCGGSADGDDISKHCMDRTCSSLSIGNVGDNVSETSMLDSISHLNVTPDDVVCMIGQKHFWRARRAIVRQQRMFAIQLFELHRLIKVQQLIAGSPEVLLEECTLLGNSTLKGTPAKKIPSQYVVKPLEHICTCKDNSDKPNHKLERSAENAVGKAHFRAKADSQPSTLGPDSGNLQTESLATNTKMASFHHPTVHQWLFPVVSPSEGLIYKPCPGPVFLGSVSGGYGPDNAMPLTNHRVSPAYGIPAHHQSIGFAPAVPPPFGHTYLPPYGMPVSYQSISGSVVHQSNLYAGPASNYKNTERYGGPATANLNHQNSRKVPTERVEAVSLVVNSQASEVNELQANIASVRERSQTGGKNCVTERRGDVLPNFPVATVATKDSPRPHGTDQPTRPIRVVPHNGRSATESVARIFRSIQKEREQIDSI